MLLDLSLLLVVMVFCLGHVPLRLVAVLGFQVFVLFGLGRLLKCGVCAFATLNCEGWIYPRF